MNLFPGYLKSIVQPRSALCHLILDVGRDLNGVTHNIAVGYGVFLRVNRSPNWWQSWRLRFQCFLNTLGTLPGQATWNTCLGNSTLPSEWSPLNGRVGYTTRWINGKQAPREVDVARRIVAIASHKKGVCVFLSPLWTCKILQLIFLFLSSIVSASMVGNSDSETKNTYSYDRAVKAHRDNQVELGIAAAIMWWTLAGTSTTPPIGPTRKHARRMY
jgi:hypothetical protein